MRQLFSTLIFAQTHLLAVLAGLMVGLAGGLKVGFAYGALLGIKVFLVGYVFSLLGLLWSQRRLIRIIVISNLKARKKDKGN